MTAEEINRFRENIQDIATASAQKQVTANKLAAALSGLLEFAGSLLRPTGKVYVKEIYQDGDRGMHWEQYTGRHPSGDEAELWLVKTTNRGWVVGRVDATYVYTQNYDGSHIDQNLNKIFYDRNNNPHIINPATMKVEAI